MKKKKTKVFASSIIAVLVLCALSYAMLGNPSVAYNNHKLNKAMTSIDKQSILLNEVVPFEWDAVYTFDPYTPMSVMEDKLGFRSNDLEEAVNEGMTQLIFIKGQKVVSCICGYPDSLGYSVSFNMGDKSYQKIMYSDNAMFAVDKCSNITRLKMSLTSIGGGYRFGLQAASISPASLKHC
jgi:hypothetical protein